MKKVDRKYYLKGYHAGYRRATIDHLGGKCVKCGENNPNKLEIHHKKGLCKKNRNENDYKNLRESELQCETCHECTPNFRGKGKRK